LTEGNVTLDKFTDEKVNDPKITQLIEKTEAKLVPELKLGAKVIVKMKNGDEYKRELKYPKGSPENPLSIDEIET